jgi:hypothetical protein
MKTISLKSHIGRDGLLKIEIPTEEKETDVEIVIIIDSIKNSAKGWSQNFLNKMYGCCKDSPLERLDQGELPKRDTLI